MRPQRVIAKNYLNFKYLNKLLWIAMIAVLSQTGGKVALATNIGGLNVAPDGGPEKERGWRRGGGGRRGNEDSERPKGPVRANRPVKDRKRDNDDNQRERAKDGCPEGTMSVTFSPDNLTFSVLFDQFIAKVPAGSNGGGNGRGRGGQGGGNNGDVIRCNIIVPFEIPNGQRMTITRIDYRGFVSLPAGAVGVLRSTYAFVGGTTGLRGVSPIIAGNGFRPGKDQNSGNGSAPGGVPNPPFGNPDRREPGRGFGRGHGDAVVNFNYRFQGPTEEDYLLSSDALVDRDAISPCGGTAYLALRNVARINNVKNAATDATLTVDSLDGRGNLESVYYVRWESCQP